MKMTLNSKLAAHTQANYNQVYLLCQVLEPLKIAIKFLGGSTVSIADYLPVMVAARNDQERVLESLFSPAEDGGADVDENWKVSVKAGIEKVLDYRYNMTGEPLEKHSGTRGRAPVGLFDKFHFFAVMIDPADTDMPHLMNQQALFNKHAQEFIDDVVEVSGSGDNEENLRTKLTQELFAFAAHSGDISNRSTTRPKSDKYSATEQGKITVSQVIERAKRWTQEMRVNW